MSSKEEENGEFFDFYMILQCDRTATLEELKRNYQRLVLTLHPDKNNQTEEAFLRLQKAWSVLRDPHSRKQYDAELSCREHADCLLYDTICLMDMTCTQSDQVYLYPCRCGGSYVLKLDDVKQQHIVIPCDECSFSIQVNTL